MKVPVFNAVSKRIMTGGLPVNIAILFWTFTASLFFSFQKIWLIPVLLIVYALLVRLYKFDQYFVEILIEHINSPDYLF